MTKRTVVLLVVILAATLYGLTPASATSLAHRGCRDIAAGKLSKGVSELHDSGARAFNPPDGNGGFPAKRYVNWCLHHYPHDARVQPIATAVSTPKST